MKFHMSSDMHFGSDMSSGIVRFGPWSFDKLEILVLSLLTCQIASMTMINCQIGCDGCKKTTLRVAYIDR